jgi:hypothetical protein
MRRNAIKTLPTVAFAVLLALGSVLALAQEKPADTMQIVREKIGGCARACR